MSSDCGRTISVYSQILVRQQIVQYRRSWAFKFKTQFNVYCSLGKEKRQLELMRITKENQMILIRLSQCRTRYDVKNWHKEWLKTLKVMDNIACYPRGRVHQQKVSFIFLFVTILNIINLLSCIIQCLRHHCLCPKQGQEKFTKKCRDYNKEQKTGADATTYSPVTNKANEKEHLKKMRKRKDTNKKEGIGIEVQQTSWYP